MSTLHPSTQKQLKAFIERVENLEEEKAALSSDIKDVFAEAKAMGFDVKVMRQVIRLRKQEDHERRETEAVLSTYMHALGMELNDFSGEFQTDASEEVSAGPAPAAAAVAAE